MLYIRLIFPLLAVAVCVLALIAGLLSINLFAKLAKEKGHFEQGTGILWFIGLFASPIVLGIYVAALQDRRTEMNAGICGGKNVNDELPSI